MKKEGTSYSEQVREYVERHAVEPARKQGQMEFPVVAGEVHKSLGFSNRLPLVCQALRSKRLLERNGLSLKSAEGPPSGLSTRTVFTYRFVSAPERASGSYNALLALEGIGKDLWKPWGGGEAFLKQLRAEE
jgi:hypothetical protein